MARSDSALWLTATAFSVLIPLSIAVNTPIPATVAVESRSPLIQQWRDARLRHQLDGHTTTVDALIFSPDSQVLISGGAQNDPTIRRWSVQTGRQLDNQRAQATSVEALAIGADGRILASSGGDTGIHIWQNGRYERAIINHFHNILALAISPDGRVLVSGGLDGIRVWDLIAQRPLYTLARFGTPTYKLAISTDGYTLASGGRDGRVQLWDLRTGDRLGEWQAPDLGPVTALAFTPDGETLLAGGDDRLIYIWDLATGETVRPPLRGHTGEIRALTVHPSGEFFASASDDGARLWELPSGDPIGQLNAHQDWTHSLAFSPDGRFLATGSYDRQIAIWEALTEGQF
ncbi:MAG: WD40 repeat domain-containing protein [Spirulinaceae cyanobacterium SM2_1_0]|nr:WD40 repeat domain-containing protein [Spirulinaceae cyanobacterium SM2_1_0]